jgi:aconitate hydratase
MEDMMYDFDMIEKFYASYARRVGEARGVHGRPMTLTEKILYAHLHNSERLAAYGRGADYADFRPDRAAMQDATAQMALLQFMNAGMERSAIPATVHCDHLIIACRGARDDLNEALRINCEVYEFLRAASSRYGLGFWKPGAGIIHQIVLENYAFPGGMMIGSDSHTPNAGGLGMIAVGVGGADVADVMCGMEWELKMPLVIGVRLTGRLSGWASAKDVILKLAGLLTVKGATNSIIEYFGEGAASIAATGKATICNMGAETGATCSVFPFDANMEAYLRATGRERVADECVRLAEHLRADDETGANPELYYDRVIEIDLSTLEPHVNGPFTPDAATPVSKFAEKVLREAYPSRVEAALIGSCTNSSYQDLCRAASVVRQAVEENIAFAVPLTINPGSEQIERTAAAEGIGEVFAQTGATIMANACGPCIGQWIRHTDDNTRPNSIVTSFNRNFAKRADGNPNTHAFVASPEMTAAFALSGDLCFNPMTDTLTSRDGRAVKLKAPEGEALPPGGFVAAGGSYIAPSCGSEEIVIDPASERLQRLEAFAAANYGDFRDLCLLIKVEGKCTTDHISPAGKWLRFRGHLENISDNLLSGAVNSFNGKTNSALNRLTGTYESVSSVAKAYKFAGLSSVVVAGENYGEGSSREHAAMEPRFLNVKAIIAKSFARIHETNLKKQGMLALSFADADDYGKVRERDSVEICGIESFAPGRPLTVLLRHDDGSEESFAANHTFNEAQIEWFAAGGALNHLRTKRRETETLIN